MRVALSKLCAERPCHSSLAKRWEKDNLRCKYQDRMSPF